MHTSQILWLKIFQSILNRTHMEWYNYEKMCVILLHLSITQNKRSFENSSLNRVQRKSKTDVSFFCLMISFYWVFYLIFSFFHSNHIIEHSGSFLQNIEYHETKQKLFWQIFKWKIQWRTGKMDLGILGGNILAHSKVIHATLQCTRYISYIIYTDF